MAHLLQIFISVLTISILSEAKCRLEYDTYRCDVLYPPNTPVHVSLNCSQTVMMDESVYWKKEGVENPVGNGSQLKIKIWGPLDAGNYTCWNKSTLLRHVLVFIEKKTPNGGLAEPMLQLYEGPRRTYIKCKANSYSGNFTCSWKIAHHYPDMKFTIRTENGNLTSRRIICDEPMRNVVEKNIEYTVSCRTENFCPSTEEYKHIEFTLEVVRQFVLEKHIPSFFIRDILIPDVSECQIVKHDNTAKKLMWSYPKTWSTPGSYFGLMYRIERVQHKKSGREICSVCNVDGTTLHRNGSTLTCYLQSNRHEQFRIQSKDFYHMNAPWSSWSEYCRGGSHYKTHKRECQLEMEPCKCQKN